MLTVDNEIDQSTGTVRLKAVFDNHDQALFPSQFVNVQLLADTERAQLIVPSSAVQQGPQGSFVYVVARWKGPGAACEGRPHGRGSRLDSGGVDART